MTDAELFCYEFRSGAVVKNSHYKDSSPKIEGLLYGKLHVQPFRIPFPHRTVAAAADTTPRSANTTKPRTAPEP